VSTFENNNEKNITLEREVVFDHALIKTSDIEKNDEKYAENRKWTYRGGWVKRVVVYLLHPPRVARSYILVL